jgi:4-amino-4-deoxychorismate lyase
MSRLIESIRLLDGRFCNLFYHEQRMIRALDLLYGTPQSVNLEKLLGELTVPATGLFKCRILYDDAVTDISLTRYSPRVIRSLKVVEHDTISYAFKYENRTDIEQLFEKRGGCDDILIVKKGDITDSSYSNVVFSRGKEWFTPWSTLLKGTMRQNLIENNKVREEDITLKDLRSFDKCKLINAMFAFDGPEIDVSDIVL